MVYSQKIAPKYSNEFLQIGVGADALGNGNAVVAQTSGVNSGYWNPAGLTAVNQWLDVAAMHSSYFGGIAKYDYLGLAHQIDKKSSAGLSLIRFAVDDIPNTTQLIDNEGRIDYDKITTFTAADYAFIGSYARKMRPIGLSVGGSVKVVYRKIGDFAKSWGFGFDFGAQYEYSKKIKFGLVVRDATSTFNAWIFDLDEKTKEVFTLTGNELPQNGLELTLPRILVGVNRKVNIGEKGLTFSGEVDLDVTTDGKRNTLIRTGLISVDPHVGISFGYKDLVQLRGGISNIQQQTALNSIQSWTLQPNVGVGIHLKNTYIDYAFTKVGAQESALYTHIVSLRLILKKPTNAVK